MSAFRGRLAPPADFALQTEAITRLHNLGHLAVSVTPAIGHDLLKIGGDGILEDMRMTTMPAAVQELLSSALAGELTVVGSRGQPITHPLLPLWDGDKIYMTSSVLFSKKLEHIKRNGRVSLAISDPVATGGLAARCTIQGDARIIEDDPHDTWEQVLPLWRAKEPAIADFLAKRFALPLFFERSVIEITPRRVLWWDDGDPSRAPQSAQFEEAV